MCCVSPADELHTTDTSGEAMARLVAVCREGEEDYPFLARQIPLNIDDTLTVSKLSHVYDNKDFLRMTGV